MNAVVSATKLTGTVTVPPSKSYLHRAIIASALADGETVIQNFELSDDIQATINCVKALGAKVEINANACKIIGGKFTQNAELNCLESGTTLRLMLPICSALGINGIFSGQGKLPTRPNDELLSALSLHGVKVKGNNLPLELSNKLNCGIYEIDAGISSQYISGLLFALPLLDGDSTIILKNGLKSAQYVEITLDVLNSFGIEIKRLQNGFFVKGNQTYLAKVKYFVEGDYSQAAFWLVGGAISGDITVKGINNSSIQGDSQIIKILQDCGVNLVIGNGQIVVKQSKIQPIDIDCENIIDLVPILAVLAICTKGISVFRGVDRLKLKESNRLKAIIDNLNALGIKTEYTSNELKIISGTCKRAKVDGYNDHRIVMAFAIMSLITGKIEISTIEAINKSYPKFFEEFVMLGGRVDVINMGK